VKEVGGWFIHARGTGSTRKSECPARGRPVKLEKNSRTLFKNQTTWSLALQSQREVTVLDEGKSREHGRGLHFTAFHGRRAVSSPFGANQAKVTGKNA